MPRLLDMIMRLLLDRTRLLAALIAVLVVTVTIGLVTLSGSLASNAGPDELKIVSLGVNLIVIFALIAAVFGGFFNLQDRTLFRQDYTTLKEAEPEFFNNVEHIVEERLSKS